MANTGQYAYELLEQYNVLTGLPTGTTKLNSAGDPDYVAPRDESNGLCPLTRDPVISARGDSRLAGANNLINFFIESDVVPESDILVNVSFFSYPQGEVRTIRLIPSGIKQWESGDLELFRYEQGYDYGYIIHPGDGYIVSHSEYAFLIYVAPRETPPGGGGGGMDIDGDGVDDGPPNPDQTQT